LTLPNPRWCWVEQDVGTGDGADELVILDMAGEDRIAERSSQLFAAGPAPTTSGRTVRAARAQLGNGGLEHVEALLLDQPAEEERHRLIVRKPRWRRHEGCALQRPEFVIDTAAPDADMVVEPGLAAQILRQRSLGASTQSQRL
jgi:hypothetical protein